MGFWRRQWNRFRNWWISRWDRPYSVQMVEELPDKLKSKTLYIVGEDGHLWFAAMICPCGCRETLQLGLLKDTSPRWTIETTRTGLPSLRPSVWRQVGCRSHFFLTNGRITWC